MAAEFERNFALRGEVGAGFVAIVEGEAVVDLYGGEADPRSGAPWTHETMCPIFSGTKGLVAACMLLLAERGLVDFDEPVGTYWPQYAAAGKEHTLVRHVVSHTAGIPGVMGSLDRRALTNHAPAADRIAASTPFWTPGQEVSYHAFTFGTICQELALRTDGRSLGQILREEIAGPRDLDVWIGLPAEQDHHVATLVATPQVVADTEVHPVDERVASVTVAPVLFGGGLEFVNSTDWRRAEIPAANGIASAPAMARLYALLLPVADREGGGILQAETVAAATQQVSHGVDPLMGDTLTFGLGFALQNEEQEFGPVATGFGHGGAGGSVHGAWPDRGVAFSYTMNLIGADLARSAALLGALDQALLDR